MSGRGRKLNDENKEIQNSDVSEKKMSIDERRVYWTGLGHAEKRKEERHKYINDIFGSGRGRTLKDERQLIQNSDGSEKKLKAERQEVFIEMDMDMQRKEKKRQIYWWAMQSTTFHIKKLFSIDI